ncbi:hypothetical protein H6A12_12540 [Phocea massiliensis]|uniref:Large polyvalent protein associated domain-containing protein n=1 Tax=Merdimmobilis hominis TaxID=2897707 RepID=A0A938X9S1_9FIRM|nr:LPD28 domain-containing protein [Merdimmobilis hominis]MBM6921967.1 hypothetical protein [Merdimmobilis hominis]
MPELLDVRLDSPTLDEMNFFAKRLAFLGFEEILAFQAIAGRDITQNNADELVSIKDLINTTYGLETVMIAADVSDDELLGQFVIESELHDDVNSVPDNAVYLLDRKKIGRLQREIDGGIFINDFYIVAGEYERPEIYDGKTLPNEEPSEWYAFRLKIAEAPMNSADETAGSAEWISLPIVKSEADRIANLHNEGCIEDCVYFDFESSIPQITSEMFGDMQDFDKLNRLAEKITYLSPVDQLKFKAVLCAEQPADLESCHDIIDHLWQYQITAKPDDAGAFFKQYLSHHLDSKFDSEWLDTLFTRNEGERLLKRLGASCTPYGVISARGHLLYELVACHEPEVEELKTQAFTDEKLDVIEVLGRKALFSNGRILPEEIPEGLYAYDLRYSDEEGQFIFIEPKVGVNHGGTVLMRELLDFREKGYLSFIDDTSPNFLGYDLTPREFMETEPSQEEENEQQFGGMQL